MLARRAASALLDGPSPRCTASLLTSRRTVWNEAPPVALSSPGGEPVPVPFYDRRVEEVNRHWQSAGLAASQEARGPMERAGHWPHG